VGELKVFRDITRAATNGYHTRKRNLLNERLPPTKECIGVAGTYVYQQKVMVKVQARASNPLVLRVEFLLISLKTDSGYPRDAEVTLFTLANPESSLRFNTHLFSACIKYHKKLQ